MALWQRLTGWLAFLSNGEAGQQDTQRVMEAILPVASLYGVDIGNVETRWFRHDKTVVVKFFWTRRSDGRVMHRRATGRQGWPAFRTVRVIGSQVLNA
ncbi:hypothetical protein, partial [Klebsiella sp. 131256]